MDTFSKYILPPTWFLETDVVKLARDLIGKVVFSNINGEISAAIITETEAYAGITDKASHAYGGKRTKRTSTMYLSGGHTYVYLIYGIYHLLNFVSNQKDIPHAILVRGGYPIEGIQFISNRISPKKVDHLSLSGPGKFSKSMGITKDLDALLMLKNDQKNSIWLEDWGYSEYLKEHIEVSKRIGIDYAEEDAELPYRFLLSLKSPKILELLKKISKPIDY